MCYLQHLLFAVYTIIIITYIHSKFLAFSAPSFLVRLLVFSIANEDQNAGYNDHQQPTNSAQDNIDSVGLVSYTVTVLFLCKTSILIVEIESNVTITH